MVDTAAARERLESRLNELASRIGQVEAELRKPVSQSFEEQATERESDEVLEDLEEAALTEMAAIRAALARIDEGIYGHCAICSKDIAPARLEALPHAPLCIECASEPERQ